tara:strand:+ start:1004 stop:3085 length:2082 start_codon:yes stop_codon:yes gene_type:complete
MANTFTARDTLKTKLLAALGSATNADQIVKLSRTIERANLDDDADLETALDTKVSAMATTASTGDIEKLAFGVKKLRTAATASDPVSSMVPEGSSNLYVTDSRVRSSFSASGDLSYDSGTGVLSYTALPDALTVYATVADLPLPENTNVGAKGIVEENKKLYINSGSDWLNVGLVDQKPSFTTTPDGSYSLTPGEDTVITLAATDPQGDPITFSHVVSAGSLGGSTVSQSGNVFTITGSSNSADTAPFSITFRASDGTNITDATSEFTLNFSFDWNTINVYNLNLYQDGPSGSTKYGRNIVASENLVFTGDTTVATDSIIRMYPQDGSAQYTITNTTDNRQNAPHPSTNQSNESLVASGNLVAFSGNVWSGLDTGGRQYAHGFVVDVWDVSDPANPQLKFVLSANDFGTADQISKLSPDWGKIVALNGTTLAVSDHRWGMGSPSGARGAVWVFDLSQGTLSDPSAAFQYVIETPVDATYPDRYSMRFGGSMDISGNGKLAVAVPNYPYESSPYGYGERKGAVDIYDTATGNLITRIDISANDIISNFENEGAAYEWNAMRISKDGTKIVVGDEKQSTDGGVKGYVAVYDVATGSRDFIKEARHHLSDANSFFGRWVDISDDGKYIIAGAMGAENLRGKLFFCRVDGGVFWSGGNTLELTGPAGEQYFASTVAFGNDRIFVSSLNENKVRYYSA